MTVGSSDASLNSGALFSCGFLPLVLRFKHMNEFTHRHVDAKPKFISIHHSIGCFQCIDTDGDTLEVRFGDNAHAHLAPACIDYLSTLINDDEAVGFHHWQLEALHKSLSERLAKTTEQHKLVAEVAA